MGKGSSRMRGPKQGGPTSSSSSSARDHARRSIRWRASFSPTPSRRPSRPLRVGCVTGGGVGYLSPRGGGGGGSPRRSTARGQPSASRSMVSRVRLRLAAGSLSFLTRAPSTVGILDVAPCSRHGGRASRAGVCFMSLRRSRREQRPPSDRPPGMIPRTRRIRCDWSALFWPPHLRRALPQRVLAPSRHSQVQRLCEAGRLAGRILHRSQHSERQQARCRELSCSRARPGHG